jgi:predicted KAP-like P-loop ATPase
MIPNNDKATDNKEEHSADNKDGTSNNDKAIDNKEDKTITSFSSDNPIDNEKDDIIGSNGFAERLGDSILKYKENESLVIALRGEWGQGKSSVINLTKKYLEKKAPEETSKKADHATKAEKNNKENASDDKLTIIDFNPWSFSEENTITGCFFNEIATKLEEKQKSNTKDKKIAKKLRYYASLISSAPNQKTATLVANLIFPVILALVVNPVFLIPLAFKIPIIIVIFIYIFCRDFRDCIVKLMFNLIDTFYKGSNYHFKSISEIKEELRKDLEDRLEKRKENILIIIDDIDRLNQEEIKQIFKLIKNNANFPSFIYLTSFDRKIVKKTLENEQEGADYLSKIVQVSFDIPLASEGKILELISEKLFVKIYLKLSEQAQKYFPDELKHLKDDYSKLSKEAKKDLPTELRDKVHGALRCFYEFKDYTSIDRSHKHPRDGCFYSFKEFFKNIRDVKRFFNSLGFNISRMINKNVIEVNPIDFIALEAIRVFTPDFYNYMRDNDYLYDYLFLPVIKSQQKSSIPGIPAGFAVGFGAPLTTLNTAIELQEEEKNKRKEKLEKALKEYTGKDSRYEKPLKDLLMRLFPQIFWIYNKYYNLTTEQSKSKWKTEQRICDPKLYNAYFAYIYGGGEGELTQYEKQEFLNASNSVQELETLLKKDYIKEDGKFEKLLTFIQELRFRYGDDDISKENRKNIIEALFNIYNYDDYKPGDTLDSAILQLFNKEYNTEENLLLLKKFIPKIKIYFQFRVISHLIDFPNRQQQSYILPPCIVPQESIKELKNIPLTNIKDLDYDDLVSITDFKFIITKWKEWRDHDNKDLEKFIKYIKNDISKTVKFIKHFIINGKIDYKGISKFMDLNHIKNNFNFLSSHYTNDDQETIDLFLRGYDDI